MTALMKASCFSLRRISRTRNTVLRTSPATKISPANTPRTTSTPLRQLATSQPILSATANAIKHVPRAIEKMTESRRWPGSSTLPS